MTSAPTTLTYCTGCGRLIPASELQAGLSEAREAGVVCIGCIEKTDPKRAATIRELSFREAERAKVSVQLMWAPPGVIPSRAARLAGETSPGPGAVDPISGQIGREQLGPALSPYHGPPVEFRPARHMPWWVVGLGALCMAVLGALAERWILGGGRPPAPEGGPTPTGVAALNHPDRPDILPPGNGDPAAGTVETPAAGGNRGQRQPGTAETPPPPAPLPPPVTTPPPGATVGATPAAPSADDEQRAKTLLASADEVFEKAPAAAEKLYQNILDFYPQTAAATLARLRLSDLQAAADRTSQSQLQGIFDAAMKAAAPERYWETKSSAEALQATTPHGPESTRLKAALTAKLDTKLEELKLALTAQGPFLIGGCIQKGDLTRAEALLQAMDRFTDPTTIATASALHQQLDMAKVEADYRQQAPAIEKALKAAPYLRNFDQRVSAWDFAAAQRELDAADKAGVWTDLGPGMRESMQAVAGYLGGPFRDELVRKAKLLAASKEPVAVRVGGAGLEAATGATKSGSWQGVVQTGPLLSWVSLDGFTQSINGRDRRVFWRQVAAESLYELARFQAADAPAEGPQAEAAAAAEADLVGAVGALAAARGELSAAAAAEQYVGGAAWQRLARLRVVLESEQQGTAITAQLALAVQNGSVLEALYGLQAVDELLRNHGAPLAFLAPDGRATLGDARALLRSKQGGTLAVFENFRQPAGNFSGIRMAQLAERGGAEPAARLLVIGADGGAQRVLVQLEGIRVPAGQRVEHAFLRLRDLEVTQAGTANPPPAAAELLGLTPLPRPADWQHFTWEFCDTLNGTRWPRPGADPEAKTEVYRPVPVPASGPREVVFDLTPYFAALAATDYTAVGNGLLLKVLKNEPDYRITFPNPRLPTAGGSSVRLELHLVPKPKPTP